MSDPRTHDPKAVAEANRLYWETDSSVNQIADDLGLSKSSLYGLIEQLETGQSCPDCRSDLVFPNRTARDRGMVSCPACGFEAQADEVFAVAAVEGATAKLRASAGGVSHNTRVLAGTALLGLATGMLLSSVLRRR